VVLAQDASPEIRRTAHGVDAIVAACGVIADALLGLDGAAAANDRQRAWDHLHAIHATREEAFCALDEARRIVRAAWPKILRAAPVLARLGALDGAQVRQLLR